jgi:hypothetical protein
MEAGDKMKSIFIFCFILLCLFVYQPTVFAITCIRGYKAKSENECVKIPWYEYEWNWILIGIALILTYITMRLVKKIKRNK